MSWGLGWKRPTEVFHLTLSYGQDADTIDDVSPRSSLSSSAFSGSSPSSLEDAAAPTANSNTNPDQLGFKIELDWNAADDDDQVALKLQSQVMVALPTPQDIVEVELTERTQNGDPEVDLESGEGERVETVGVEMRVVKKREPLKGVLMWKAGGSGQQTDGGMGVLVKLMRLNFANGVADGAAVGSECADHWRNVSVVSLCGLGLSVSVSLTKTCNSHAFWLSPTVNASQSRVNLRHRLKSNSSSSYCLMSVSVLLLDMYNVQFCFPVIISVVVLSSPLIR